MYLSNDILTHNMLNNNAKSYLLARGIDEKTAYELGFFTASKGTAKQLLNQDISGLCITYFNFAKKPISYRLRPFEQDWNFATKKRDKYLETKGELPKFLSKAKPPNKYDEENERLIVAEPELQRINKPYFCPVLNWNEIQQKTSIDIVITEGELKGALACLKGIPTIALPGVDGFVNKIKNPDGTEHREFLPDLEWLTPETDKWKKTYWENRNVALVFDSDIVSKWQVQRALKELAKRLRMKGAKPFLVLLPNEPNGDKNGIDDFIVRHGHEAFKKLIEQFKILDQSPQHRLMDVNQETLSYQFRSLEPIASMKGLMCWSVLKDQLAYRESFGWYEWTGKYWKNITESKVLGIIQEFRYSNQWLMNGDKNCFDDFKNALSRSEIEFNNPHILGFENGYLNADTNEFFPHDKNYYLTSILPFDYQETAQCPEWFNFLYEAFEGDVNKIEYARAWLRWILTPKENKKFPIEATLWAIGEQGTGKGTFLNIMKNLIGENNYGVFSPEDITNMNMLYGLADKKLAINDDVTGFIQNIGTYNKICSNEPVNVKHLYHDVFPTRLNTVTVLAMNKALGFSGNGSEGMKRRLHVLEFNRIPDVVDVDLSEKLETELSGIFSWVWGLTFAQTKKILKWRSAESVASVYESQLPEIAFLKATYPNGCDLIKASELYSTYAEWRKNNGYEKTNSQNFYLSIKKIKTIKKQEERDANYYVIPTMYNYHDSQFNNTISSPTDVINNVNETVEGSCKGGTFQENHCGGLRPDTERPAEGSEGFDQKVFESQEKIEDSKKSFTEKPSTPSTIHTPYGLNPPQTDENTLHTPQPPMNKPIEPITPKNQDDLSKYKGFQKVGQLNSSDIREARNRSEKIKNDILACTNNEELQLVKTDFGYLPKEIKWVWTHLLSKQEQAQIEELTKREQQSLTLEIAQKDWVQETAKMVESKKFYNSLINNYGIDYLKQLIADSHQFNKHFLPTWEEKMTSKDLAKLLALLAEGNDNG